MNVGRNNCSLRRCRGKRGCICTNKSDLSSLTPLYHKKKTASSTTSKKGIQTGFLSCKSFGTHIVENRINTKKSSLSQRSKNSKLIGAKKFAQSRTQLADPKKNKLKKKASKKKTIGLKKLPIVKNDMNLNNIKENSANNLKELPIISKTDIVEPDIMEIPIVVHYNHHKSTFLVKSTNGGESGNLEASSLNDAFCFSVVFKGDFNIKISPSKDPADVTFSARHDEVIIITNKLIAGQEYFCRVDEDEDAESLARNGQEKTVYKCADANSSSRFLLNGEEKEFGEDKASCSCIEGNPCQSKYNCKNWNERFAIAKRNGWKGHM